LSIAFDYGGRAEILDAVRRIVKDGIRPEKITESLFSSYLYTPNVPEPDLIIRTAGEMRLSNFLVWQSAYSEYYATPTLWPDFNEEEVDKALLAYSHRERRFGGLKAEGEAKGT
jgi:undecaprenyl diphosphate synthase